MRISVEIAGIGQKMDLHTNTVAHTLELLLPDGSTVTVTADEKAVERVVQLSVGASPSTALPPAQDESDWQYGGVAEAGSTVQVFGGTPLPQDDLPVAPVQRVVPARTVPHDEMGNPIVPAISRQQAVSEGGDEEDDGVPPL